MSELLNELARSLAKPMQRRRALRVLGATLLGMAFPATRASAGRSTHNCPAYNEFLCQCPAANGLFFKVCCPNPTPTLEYECTCSIPNQATCVPKKPKRCGPDIINALEDAVSRTRAAFAGWSSAKRVVACDALVQTPIGLVGWEINQLGPGKREEGAKNYQPECATCAKSLSVQVGEGCHSAGSVNYVIYGVMLRLCHDHFSNSIFKGEAKWFTEEQMAHYITIYKTLRQAPNLAASLKWAKAGYNNWPGGSTTPPPELPNCAECPKEFRGRLTVRWLPLGLNI